MRSMCPQYRFVLLLIVLIVLTLSVSFAAEIGDKAASLVKIQLKSSTPTEVELEFNLEDFQSQEIFVDQKLFHRFIIDGEPSVGPDGWPELPSIRRMVLIPPQSGVELRVNNLKTHMEENVNPISRQTPEEGAGDLAMNFDGTPDQFVVSEHAEKFQGFWPPEVASIGEPAIMRGYRILPVVINPIRWNRQTGQLEVVDGMDIVLDFNSDQNQTNIVSNPLRPRPSQAVFEMVSNLVVNPPEPSRDIGTRNGSIVYVIKQWNDVEQALQPLIEWRRQMGWTVEVIRVANNANNAVIKAAIQEAYDEWSTPPEMIIICGDTDGPHPMACWDHRTRGQYPYESDHDYVMLEGNDVLPDAAIGRFPFYEINTGTGRLRDIVNKIVDYESDPFIGQGAERGWQKRAALFAGDSRSGRSSIDVLKWSKELLIRNGYNRFFERYWTPQVPQPDGRNWIPQVFSAGIGFYVYRGWANMNDFPHAAASNLENGEMLPYVLLPTCNTGDFAQHNGDEFYYTERMLFSPIGGGIGAVGAGGATHTAYNNLFTAANFRSIFGSKNPYMGWAMMNGKVELYQHYFDRGDVAHHEQPELEGWLCETYIFNLMGDPATQLFTDIPQRIDIEHPDYLRVGESHVEIQVFADGGDETMPGARVCLYKADEFQVVKYSDDAGRVVFDLDPEWTGDGTVKLTVTGHNLFPYSDNLRIRQAETFLAAGNFSIDDDDEGDSRGDGDGTANPTERIELTISIENFGEDVPDGQVSLILTPSLPNLEVVQGEVELENAPAAGESEDVLFVVDIGGGFPDEQHAIFNLECSVGEENWLSSVSLPLAGPEFDFVSVRWRSVPLRPAGVADLRIRIRNNGSKRAPELNANLVSMTRTVGVPIAESSYSSVPAHNSSLSHEYFRLAANLFHLGGKNADFALILNSEGGFVDTVFFSIPVDQARHGQPFGPDQYGYICLDDTDTDWYSAPEYEWIEIDPHRRGEGIDTRLQDTAENLDASTLVDLPFTFSYYGIDFDEITICTNGWLAMGDCEEIITARNRRFPAGMCAPGMIGPFWEDLLTTDNGGIYTYYDEDNHRFIVEWSQMRKLGPRGGDEASETFQVLLYDPEHLVSATGDGDIVYQYLDITDNASCFQEWDTPYASVGISSPDQGDGLTYTYWGELSDGAAALESERAIKFTSSMLVTNGEISGTVSDAETGNPIEGASVSTLHGFVAVTDEEGYYVIENAPTDIEFNLKVSCPGFCDSTESDLILDNEEAIEINFDLLHPEFNLSLDAIETQVLVNGQTDVDLNLSNDGNGPLLWRNELINQGEEEFDLWTLRQQIPVGEIVDDSRIQGAIFANNHYYVAGSNSRDPLIYIFNRNGELIDQYDQPHGINDSYGFKDLAFDGELIWGSVARMIYGFSPEGELITSFEGPFNPINNIAWDPDQELLWISGTTSNIYGVDREGNEVEVLNRQNMRLYGLSYWSGDPDGHNLYIFNRDVEIGNQVVSKMDTESGEILFVRLLEPEGGGNPIGTFISGQYDPFNWVFMTVCNIGGDDRIDVWQLGERDEWVSVEPVTGMLDAGESIDLSMQIDARSMSLGVIEGQLLFYHNGVGGRAEIPIRVEIVNELLRNFEIQLTLGWNLTSLNVFPSIDFYANENAEGPDIVLMTNQLIDDEGDHHMITMKNQSGQFYLPAFGFNNIPYWNLTEGYQIAVDRDEILQWSGRPIPSDADIPLRENWNIVAYLPEYPLSASAPDFYVISPIRDHVIQAKDTDGRFMLPGFNFSNMLPWQPGQAYMIKVDAPDLVLNYPPPDEEDLAFINPFLNNNEIEIPLRTGENMSLLISEIVDVRILPEDKIYARMFDGTIVGRGLQSNGMSGMAIWGDDPTTEAKDGLLEGEMFKLYLKRDSDDVEVMLTPVSFLENESLTYKKDGVTVLSVNSNGTIPNDFFLSSGYPNPFNSTIRLSYGLPEATDVTISIYDLTGRMVESLVNNNQLAGVYDVTWKSAGKNTASGIYFVRMLAGDFKGVRKVTYIK